VLLIIYNKMDAMLTSLQIDSYETSCSVVSWSPGHRRRERTACRRSHSSAADHARRSHSCTLFSLNLMETLARPLARNKLARPCESAARFAARCESYSAEFFFSPAGALSHENHAGGLGGARLPVHISPAGCFLPERGDMCVNHTQKMVRTEPKTFGERWSQYY